jgi:hypothetical protein
MRALFVVDGAVWSSTRPTPSFLGGNGKREISWLLTFKQVTYLNSVVMPDEVESDSDEEEEEDEGEAGETSGAGEDSEEDASES